MACECYTARMTIRVLTEPISLADIRHLAEETYSFMIKGAVDIATHRVAIGGDYHIESCEELVRGGSANEYVWGFNIVFNDGGYDIEYDSLINIKPAKSNRSRLVEDENVRTAMRKTISSFVTDA